jgi:hypothetical protein
MLFKDNLLNFQDELWIVGDNNQAFHQVHLLYKDLRLKRIKQIYQFIVQCQYTMQLVIHLSILGLYFQLGYYVELD